MAKILDSLALTLLLGLVLTLILLFGVHGGELSNPALGEAVLRDLHVLSGIVWIGLLYYFNFVQAPAMPKIPAGQRPGITRFIVPRALFLMRWAAAATVVFGLLLGWHKGWLLQALTLAPGTRLIGIGMWIGLVMALNVWVVFWPNQRTLLGLVEADDDARAKAARIAGFAGRLNAVLSLPLLYAMTAYQTLPV